MITTQEENVAHSITNVTKGEITTDSSDGLKSKVTANFGDLNTHRLTHSQSHRLTHLQSQTHTLTVTDSHTHNHRLTHSQSLRQSGMQHFFFFIYIIQRYLLRKF